MTVLEVLRDREWHTVAGLADKCYGGNMQAVISAFAFLRSRQGGSHVISMRRLAERNVVEYRLDDPPRGRAA